MVIKVKTTFKALLHLFNELQILQLLLSATIRILLPFPAIHTIADDCCHFLRYLSPSMIAAIPCDCPYRRRLAWLVEIEMQKSDENDRSRSKCQFKIEILKPIRMSKQ